MKEGITMKDLTMTDKIIKEMMMRTINESQADVTVSVMNDEPFIIITSWNDIDIIMNEFKNQYENIYNLYQKENDITDDQKMFESIVGYDSYGFDDEYMECANCNNAFSNQNYHYATHWTDYENGQVICRHCLENKENKEIRLDYLESLVNNPNSANAFIPPWGLISLGYKQMPDLYESGLHRGMNDDPKKIMKELLGKNPSGKFIFQINNMNPFQISFAVWKKEEDQ